MNTKIVVSLQIDPALSDVVDNDLLKVTFGDGFLDASHESCQPEAFRDASQLAPIVLVISAALGTAASIGAKKMIELFCQDVYQSAKQIVKALFKGKPEARREVHLELRDVDPMIHARVLSSDPDVLERALMQGLSALAYQAMAITEERKAASYLTYYNSATGQEEVISARDRLPDSIQWVLFEYEVASETWLIESVLTQDDKIYLRG